jgi:hypothetical protein
MMSQPYIDGITDKVSHNIASSLTADLIEADEGWVTIAVVCPDRWFPGDFAVVTSRDGGAFAGEVAGLDVCTGEVTIRGVVQLGAQVTPLPGLRWVSPGGVLTPSTTTARLVVRRRGVILSSTRARTAIPAVSAWLVSSGGT